VGEASDDRTVALKARNSKRVGIILFGVIDINIKINSNSILIITDVIKQHKLCETKQI